MLSMASKRTRLSWLIVDVRNSASLSLNSYNKNVIFGSTIVEGYDTIVIK